MEKFPVAIFYIVGKDEIYVDVAELLMKDSKRFDEKLKC